jgi:hypothetical protein
MSQTDAKVRNFACASSQSLRIFEGNVEVFQDAHARKPRTSSKTSAHLRQGTALDPVPQGTALNPVPLARDAVPPRVSASIDLFRQCSFRSYVRLSLYRPVEVGRETQLSSLHRHGPERQCLRLRRISSFAAGVRLTWPFRLHAGRARTKKSRAWLGTAPHGRDLQPVAVPSFCSLALLCPR